MVFVNQTEDFKTSLVNSQSAASVANSRAAAAESDAASATASSDALVMQANNQVRDVQSQLQSARTELASKDAQLAQKDSSATLAAADTSRLTDALKASEDAKSKQNDVLAQGRTDNDTLTQRNNEMNLSISDLTNRLDVANRERTNFSEQLAQSKTENDSLTKIVKDLGGNPAQPAGIGTGAVPINGIVRDTRQVNGIPYATISVGSSDNVQKGMQFYVIDRQKQLFLGQLTIDSVEPNEATGRLDGPRINAVHPGIEVRTQL